VTMTLTMTVDDLMAEFNDLIASMLVVHERNKPAVKQIQLIVLDLIEALNRDAIEPDVLDKAKYVETLALRLESWSFCNISIQKRGDYFDVVMNVNSIPYNVLGSIHDPDYSEPVKTPDQVKSFIKEHRDEYDKIIGRRFDCYNELPAVRLRRLVIKPLTQALAQKPRLGLNEFDGLMFDHNLVMV